MKASNIDEYILQASEITQPIIVYLRACIKEGCPEIEENIKWNAPSFELKGKNICAVMAFKKHVNFIIANGKDLEDEAKVLEDIGEKSNMRGIKQIVSVEDLPERAVLVAFVKAATAG